MGRRTIGMPFARLRAPAAVAVAGLAAAVAVLGGCQSEETPPATTSPSASATSASPSPSATVPTPSVSPTVEIPAAAREKSEQGAEAFARFYIAQSGRAWTEPDASLLEGLATSACATCKNLQETAKTLEAKDQRYSSTPITAEAFETFRGEKDSWVFEVQLVEQPVTILDAGGAVVDDFPRRELQSAVAVVWKEGRWWIDAIGD